MMVSRLHQRLGTAGFVLSIVALFAALAGGAYAAGALTSAEKQLIKKESKKFSKQFSKQFAVPGPAGATGAQGPAGAQGAKGDPGDDGADGTSATTASFAGTKGSCTNGGVEVKSASPAALVCNGKDGEDGEDGETGFTETLPPGETETGAWGFWPKGPEIGYVSAPFNIPLAAAPTNIVFNQPGTENCPGSVAEPQAKEGIMCVYAEGAVFNASTEPEGTKFKGILTLSKIFATGAVLAFEGQVNAKNVYGTWAVTAPTPAP